MAPAETRVASPLLSRYTMSSVPYSDILIHVGSTEITAVYISNIRIACYSKIKQTPFASQSLRTMIFPSQLPRTQLEGKQPKRVWGLGVKANKKHPRKSPI